MMLRIATFLLLAAAAGSASAQTANDNRLYLEDERIGGKFVETHPIDLEPGDTVKITLRSTDFDTFLYVQLPNEEWINNDDCTEGDTETSCLEFEAELFGTYKVLASTYNRGDYGDYTIDIQVNE